MTTKQNPRFGARAVQYSDMVSTSDYSASHPSDQPKYYWDKRSNSIELLEHWIACRGHHFGYAEVIE